jgi:2-oxo-3-hexenedioate decarboxylase
MSITNDLQLITDQLLDALDRGAEIPCLSGNRNNFDVETAYAISDIVSNKRIARGEEIIGIKIGFTNESLWEEYNVHAPIFAPMYSSTQLETGKPVDLSRFAQPKIEPELFFKIASIPNSQMTDTELLACCSHYGHGIEIVQSVFPDWTFTLPDTVAAFALHGAYLRGESYEVPQDPQSQRDLVKGLQNFSLELHMNGELVETGLAKNILSSGPLNALRHLARLNEKGISQHKIAVGQVITTGTVTSAYQLSHGQTWISKFTGLDIAGMTLEFRTE